MGLVRNLLALVGLIVVAALIYLMVLAKGIPSFDAEAGNTYWEMAKTLVQSGNGAEATVVKIPVQDGLSAEEVEEVMKFVANEHNIKNVGELPLSKEVALQTGKPTRFLKIFMFCNPLTAALMVDYSEAFSAYLPCRISLVEDKTGKLWLYTLNMDLMIHGGEELPDDLKKEALEVKKVITDIMARAAEGDF
ncbi:MAG: DUF302 domain-containing protein [bacterium]